MLLSSFLANTKILSYFFFLFLVIFSSFLIIPFVRKKIEVRLALAIPTGAPAILVNETVDTPLLVARETIKILSMKSKAVTYLLIFLLHDFL